MMMLGIQTRRWRNLQRPSMKCWSLQNVRSTSTLSFVISQVMALKAQFNLGRECYDAIMTVFGRFLPKGHVMPANLYQSDKILRALKMPYDKIHACEKGCVLFRLDYADLNYCPICKSSRYVVNGMGEKTQTKMPVNVLQYFPIVPRLQRLFMVEEIGRAHV